MTPLHIVQLQVTSLRCKNSPAGRK